MRYSSIMSVNRIFFAILSTVSLGRASTDKIHDIAYIDASCNFNQDGDDPDRNLLRIQTTNEGSWFYNREKGNCIFRSPSGPEVGFENATLCHRVCIQRQLCALESSATGKSCPSASATMRWTFDRKLEGCVKFEYKGCGGNANRFDTPEACWKACQPDVVCRLQWETGSCRARLPSWSFDVKKGRCKEFTYGGCKGNDNQFDTLDACSSFCGQNLNPEASDD